jgi:Domain of unknown function (DUF4430)
VSRRPLALLAALAATFALAPLAQAARVSIRVEGRTQTIFARAPRLVEAQSPLEALDLASRAGEFYVHVQQSAFGPFVDQIGLYQSTAGSGWVYKVNGASPPVGADQYRLKDGDSVLWYWADFDATTFAGPRTLLLVKTSRRCYAAFEQDDNGTRTAARNVRIWVGPREKGPSTTGRFCLRAHTGLVHVRKPGLVRSNGLP